MAAYIAPKVLKTYRTADLFDCASGFDSCTVPLENSVTPFNRVC
jgi:hypothetical protein